MRELEAAKSAGTGHESSSSSPWSTASLAGFRVGGNPTSFSRTVKFSEPAATGAASSTSANGSGNTSTAPRAAQVTVSAPNGPDGAFAVHVTDYSGQQTSFPVAKPTLIRPSVESGGSTISTLLGEQLSLVDIVAQSQTSSTSEGGEKLSLFNTGESFVGAVDVLPPSWMSLVGGNKQAAAGSARAPMREFEPSSGMKTCHLTDKPSISLSLFHSCIASRIVQIFVEEGQTVEAGTPLVMVEAMKTVSFVRCEL